MGQPVGVVFNWLIHKNLSNTTALFSIVGLLKEHVLKKLEGGMSQAKGGSLRRNHRITVEKYCSETSTGIGLFGLI